MTILNEEVFNYIIVEEDEYTLKEDTPIRVKNQIKSVLDNFKKLYHQKIFIKGL